MSDLSSLWALLTDFANSDAGKWLPVSPFQRFLASWDGFQVIHSYLGWVNWFVPVGTILKILTFWLAAIGIFYMVMAIMRWMKIVGD